MFDLTSFSNLAKNLFNNNKEDYSCSYASIATPEIVSYDIVRNDNRIAFTRYIGMTNKFSYLDKLPYYVQVKICESVSDDSHCMECVMKWADFNGKVWNTDTMSVPCKTRAEFDSIDSYCDALRIFRPDLELD